MIDFAILLYSLALVADLLGSALGLWDLRSRMKALQAYRRPVRADLTLIWNTHVSAVGQILAAKGADEMFADTRAALNELMQDLAEERLARDAAEDRLARLAGAADAPGRLWLAAALLFAGTILGGLGNLVSASSP